MIKNQEETLQELEKETKVKVFIPFDKNAPLYKTEMVQVNGVNYQIEVGKEVEVPSTIAKVLKSAHIIY